MDPTTIDDLLRAAMDAFLKLWAQLPESVKERVRAEWMALMAAIQAARASGVGSAADFRAVLEALKRFIEALRAAGVAIPQQVTSWVQIIEQQIATAAGETAGTGTAATVGGILLIILALILSAMSIYHVYLALGPVDPPVGGPPCGGAKPIATGLEAESYAHWGQRAAFKAAEAEARAAAQTFTCTGRCSSGPCRGNCAIIDVSYKQRFFWTWCTVKYDVWCECY